MTQRDQELTTPDRDHAGAAPLRDIVRDHLRAQIIVGDYPAGSRLVEEAVAKALGVSRNPVREALRVLETEGFVEFLPRRGASVSAMTEGEVLEILTVRAHLESLTARLAARYASHADVARLRSVLAAAQGAIDQEDPARVGALNTEFHELVLRAARNQVLIDIITPLRGRLQRIFVESFSVDRAGESLREHSELVDAIADHDEERAAVLGTDHVERAHAWYRESAARRGGS